MRNKSMRSWAVCAATLAMTGLGVVAISAASPALATTPVVASRLVDHRYIEVHGEPFNPTAVQFRADRAMNYSINPATGNHFTLAEVDAYFAKAKSLGFNTITVPIRWADFEPTEGNYDYTLLDNWISTATSAGIKLELIWYGSNVDGGGFATTVPSYISSDHTTYPLYINSTGGYATKTHPQEGLGYMYSMSSPNLAAREKAALLALDNELALKDTTLNTIGIQVNNEPALNFGCSADRSYDTATTNEWNAFHSANPSVSAASFAHYQIWEYLNNLDSVFKTGPYQMYTRINLACADEYTTYGTRTAPNIDFIGQDPYSNTTGSMTPRRSDNSLAISENPPYKNTAPAMMLAEYSRGGFSYDTYQLLQQDDGSSDAANVYTIYGLDGNLQTNAAVDPALTSNAVAQLDKDPQLLSLTPGINVSYFTSDNPSFTLTNTWATGWITYTTSNGGVGVAEQNATSIKLMGIGGTGTFTLQAPVAPYSATDGYYDSMHDWVAGASVPVTNNGNGTYSVTVTKNQFVSVTFGLALGTMSASATSTSGADGQGADQLIDGTNDFGLVSAQNPSSGQSATVSYTTPQNVSGVSISCSYCQGQGVTQFDVQVSHDGTTWTKVASSPTISYQHNDATRETYSQVFGTQFKVKGVRVVVNTANLAWGHWVILEQAPMLDGPGWFYHLVNQNNGTFVNTYGSPPKANSTTLGDADWWDAMWDVTVDGSGNLKIVSRSPGETLSHATSTATYAEASTGTIPTGAGAWTFTPSGSFGSGTLANVADTTKYLFSGSNPYAELGGVGAPANSWQWQFQPTF